MTMRMKSRPLYVPIVMAVMSALAVTATTRPTEETTGSLNGKMFTLSRDSGGISFYPPYYYPSSSTRPDYTTNRPYYTTTRPYYTTTTRPWTTTTRPTTTYRWTTTTRPTPRPTTTRHWTTTTRPTPTRHWTTTTRHWTTTTRHWTTTTRPTPTRHWTTPTRHWTTTTRPTTTYPWTTTTRPTTRPTPTRHWTTTTRPTTTYPWTTTTRPTTRPTPTRHWTTTTRPTTTYPWTTTTRPTTRPTPTRHWTTTTRPTPRPTTTRHWTTTTRPTPRPTTTYPWTTTTRPTPRPTATRHWATTTRPTTTRPWTTTTRPYYTTNTYPWTTAPATRGVSVCLRYLAESVSSLFTLSPSSRAPLQLDVGGAGSYVLTFTRYTYYRLNFQANIKFWPDIGRDIWNRVCFTVDSMKNVAQVFSGSNISIRKMLPLQYVWSGEPVMDFSGFDGQLTDVQIWDYPLSYREVFNYMTSGIYAPYQGSALSWSYISYSPRGQALLEDTFELQGRQPISNRRGKKGRRPKGGKKKFYNVWESKSEQL